MYFVAGADRLKEKKMPLITNAGPWDMLCILVIRHRCFVSQQEIVSDHESHTQDSLCSLSPCSASLLVLIDSLEYTGITRFNTCGVDTDKFHAFIHSFIHSLININTTIATVSVKSSIPRATFADPELSPSGAGSAELCFTTRV